MGLLTDLLSQTRVTRADRLDRLILVAAPAYVLPVALGLWRRDHLDPRRWCTNRRRRELSAFAIARALRHRHRHRDTPRRDRLIDHLFAALFPQTGNWG